ncbi:hypothetical protein HC026_04470 [Lactobacillus sp. LC28-10]|uniref:Uncharacterized protein n=1 Tax=Secundilactobacillus angelensis TaxID=2722706 RepID=A0ABX1KW68_9LACO|nr:hypothetical protein [Secundilactobacillus angelensis]MCH5462340.1 hypothetical protein [Secundilactobacillus angelensis]NLR18178.1 hypothetical protein [Secundilactobacillus angelensis]
MARKPLKFTTAFGVTVMVLGTLLELGAFFYHAGSPVSGETVFTGAIVLTIGQAFYGTDNLFLSLLLTFFSSIGVGYFVLVQTSSWLWAIIAAIAFFAFIVALFGFRSSIRKKHGMW